MGCVFILYKRHLKNSTDPKGMLELRKWIQSDEDASNSLAAVRVAEWKKDQLVDVEGVLYLSHKHDEDWAAAAGVNDSDNCATSSSGFYRTRKKGVIPRMVGGN